MDFQFNGLHLLICFGMFISGWLFGAIMMYEEVRQLKRERRLRNRSVWK